MRAKERKLTIVIPSKDHKMMKMAAAMLDTSIKDLLLVSFQNYAEKELKISRPRVPNAETIKAIEDCENRRNLTEYDTAEEMFRALGFKC